MPSLPELLAAFAADAKPPVETPVTPDPPAAAKVATRPVRDTQASEALFAGIKRMMTGVADFDRAFSVTADPYGLVVFKTRNLDHETMFIATFIDRDEVDDVINALRRARDAVFPLQEEDCA